MLGTDKLTIQGPGQYAIRADFCRIFQQEMNSFYLLSFLLTGDHSLAERCFVRGLEESAKGNRVFKEWAQSWARRIIIQNAIQMIRPQLKARATPGAASDRNTDSSQKEPAEIAETLALPAFDRFVFVMSVLERYSDHECSLLLGCNRSGVIAARTRALRGIGKSARLSRGVVAVGEEEQPLRGEHVRLAASA
jgi:DNA-directed RNA polymerase specialized sigma24 family protein